MNKTNLAKPNSFISVLTCQFRNYFDPNTAQIEKALLCQIKLCMKSVANIMSHITEKVELEY